MKNIVKSLSMAAVALSFASCSCDDCASESFQVDKALTYCDSQVKRSLVQLKELGGGEIQYNMMPRNILKSLDTWKLNKASAAEWCAGFWPGVLWYDYEATGDATIRQEAEKFTSSLEFLAYEPAYDHDLGFLVFCSYGNGYRLTGNEEYKDIILKVSDTLATLFNPKVGTILSWPREVEPNNWPHNTIIDNMINLEMMFWAAKNGGEEHKYLYDMAVSHADVTMAHQFKPDYSNYHVTVYDTISGKFIKGVTHQGYKDESMWARGQAWGIYGFTIVYRETQDKKYMDFAEKLTDAYLKDLPADYIPYWDFSAPGIPDAPRDASAAAVVASALMDLGRYMGNEKGEQYVAAAEKMLASLSSPAYQCGDAKPALLDHSTGHHPAGSEIDASIIYADYYYMEALVKYKKYAQK